MIARIAATHFRVVPSTRLGKASDVRSPCYTAQVNAKAYESVPTLLWFED